jgi:primosomal protein N' (replication factor Y) (superfamily II helicase)
VTERRLASCQVVPDIPSFAVDDGFRYRIPDDTSVSVGSRVRVRVGGRRVRGFVTEVFDDVGDRPLLDLDGVVGTLPSFDRTMLDLLRWCATHYVGPLSVICNRTVPPNVPRSRAEPASPVTGLTPLVEYLVGPAPYGTAVADTVGNVSHGSVMVIAPSVEEVVALADVLERVGRKVVVAHSSLTGKGATSAWTSSATRDDIVLVGTREIVLWPMPAMAHLVVVEDARRVLRSPSTPTLGTREIAWERARRLGVPLTFLGPLPSLEVVHRGAVVRAPEGRSWPLVEVMDRNDEPPSASVLLDATRSAITAVARSGGAAFILVPRRGYAAAYRCSACGQLRTCAACGAAVTQPACARCATPSSACTKCSNATWRPLGAGVGVVVDDLRRSVGDAVASADDHTPIVVGTERDLIGCHGNELAVAVDVDGSALAPNYRAAEDTLRTLVRLANTVARGRGHRCIVQTSDPGQPVVEALRSGHFDEFVRESLAVRRRSGFPPFGELIALEVSSSEDPGPAVSAALAGKARIHGPATMEDRLRWLITAPDLDDARVALRTLVGSLRDRGARVRIDVDPFDL